MYQNYYTGQMPQYQAQYQPRTPGVIPQQAPAVQMPYLKGHPVASIDEARATTIDFDGSISFFPDLANQKIYTKQINADGTSSLNVYQKIENPTPSVAAEGVFSDKYVTKEEFNETLKKLMNKLSFQTKSDNPQENAQTFDF